MCCQKFLSFVSKWYLMLINFGLFMFGSMILVHTAVFHKEFMGDIADLGFHVSDKFIYTIGGASALLGLSGMCATKKYQAGLAKIYLFIWGVALLALIAVELFVGVSTAVYIGALDNLVANTTADWNNTKYSDEFTKFEKKLDEELHKTWDDCCYHPEQNKCEAVAKFLKEDSLECTTYDDFKVDVSDRVHEVLPPLRNIFIIIGALEVIAMFSSCFLTCCGSKKTKTAQDLDAPLYQAYPSSTKTTGDNLAGTPVGLV